VTKWDKIRDDVMREQVCVWSLEEIRMGRIRQWCGLLKMEEYRLPKRALEIKITVKELWVDHKHGGTT
jgi:hypothetical protein